MYNLSLFDEIPQVEQASPDCDCPGKICSLCKKLKCYLKFYPSKVTIDKLVCHCKECEADVQKMKNYGLSFAQLHQMRSQANGKCEICGEQEPSFEERKSKMDSLVVDHSHTTDKVRGLLCHRCNILLGTVKDDLELLAKLIPKADAYLKKY